MKEILSQDKKYFNMFTEYEGVNAFFATKLSAREGWPYINKEVFEANAPKGYIQVGHYQTHGTNIYSIRAEDVKGEDIKFEDSDGAITDVPGVLLTTMHADCTPIYFYDPVKRVIAMIHSGWKGTMLEIGRVTSNKMQEEFGCDPKDIIVHIGPSISQCCFEVDEDVYEMFTDPVYVKKGVKYYIDLKEYNTRMLMDTGIPRENISISEHCTCCEPELFSSYRYDGSPLRMGAGIIMI